MTSTIKPTIINSTAAIVAVLSIVGMLNMHEVVPLVDYINAHTSTGMAALYYGAAGLVLFLFPLIAGAFFEYRLWESETRIGRELANAMHNVRNDWVSLFAFGLAGGMVTFFASWGIITIVS